MATGSSSQVAIVENEPRELRLNTFACDCAQNRYLHLTVTFDVEKSETILMVKSSPYQIKTDIISKKFIVSALNYDSIVHIKSESDIQVTHTYTDRPNGECEDFYRVFVIDTQYNKTQTYGIPLSDILELVQSLIYKTPTKLHTEL